MPLYTYKCTPCNNEFDKLVSMSSRDNLSEISCPVCNKSEVTRIVNGIGLVQWEKSLQPDGAFKDLLKQIGKNNKHSTIDHNFGGSTNS